MRVLSANLLNGGADPDALADVVRSLEVDVAAVQELSFEQAETLATLLPYGTLQPARDYNGMGIALRRPADESRLTLPRRDALVARLEPAAWGPLERPLEVVNVHVSAPHLYPPWRAFAERRRQLRGVLDHLAATRDSLQVLLGDFNASPIWPLYRRLAAQRRDAAHVHAGLRGGRPRPTWGPLRRGPRVARIDHAFVQGVDVCAFHVVHLPGTDHSALMVELEA